jgi:hypothetical protein
VVFGRQHESPLADSRQERRAGAGAPSARSRDALGELDVSRQARTQDTDLPEPWIARAVTYPRKGFRPQTWLTSLTDPDTFPADEIAKTRFAAGLPSGVQQELWSVFLAYNLVRLAMERAAAEAQVPQRRENQDQQLRASVARDRNDPAFR